MSALSRLARLLQVHERQAWEFYLAVKRGFKKDPPEIQTIVNCIQTNGLKTPSVATIIKILSDGINPNTPAPPEHPDHGSPHAGTPKPQPKPKPSPGTPMGTYHWERRRHPSGGSGTYQGTGGALRRERDVRNYNRRVPTCPHGIPITNKCAICSPKDFS
jgi:hypothetical protein